MEKMQINEVLKSKGHVSVVGWVHDSRDLGKIRFIVLKDITGRIQITGILGKTNKDVYKLMDNITTESVIKVTGELKESKQAPGGTEIIPDKIEIMAAAAQPLPIDTSDRGKTELPKRLDYRFLDFHRKRTQSIFKIQSTVSLNYFQQSILKKMPI